MISRDASTDRPLIGPLTFAVSPDERARWTAIGTVSPTNRRVRLLAVNGIVMLANGLLQLLLSLGSFAQRTAMASIHLTVGIACTIAALLALFGVTRERPVFSRSRLSGDGERSFAMDERGLVLDRPTSLVPWSRVRSIEDVRDAFVVRTTLRRRYLPKRIFDDGGDAFWAYAASRMVSGGRMLVVPANRRLLRNSAHP